MKKILYTVCSANHLAHCKTMCDSFAALHPDYTIIIGLVDKIEGRFSKDLLAPHSIWEIDTLDIPHFDDITARYTVIELNCAMKAFMAQAIFAREYPDILLYLDSDMWVLHPLSVVEEQLQQHHLLITPHLTSPLPDNTRLPLERDILRSGIYNAGFMAMKRSVATDDFLHWWAQHMQTECHYQFAEGMGVDQIWLNLVPLFFTGTGIFQHPGANVAYWNIHERNLIETDQGIRVNDQYPLLFLHVSGYSFQQPEVLSRHQNRFDLGTLPVWKKLLETYAGMVKANGYDQFHVLPCLYVKQATPSLGIMKSVNRLLQPLGIKISRNKA
ncbi:MAG: hypothetical protein IM541_05785 [Chitinophagaceae bacterium]|nr:hypothetical protein [Chitinophagaceae bacterium]